MYFIESLLWVTATVVVLLGIAMIGLYHMGVYTLEKQRKGRHRA